ncbi:MAG: hypothetical protein JW875_01540 [Spirochaetales bacterium]|nr:hypothetical protein [Spirochaetales bacterium]
MSRRLVILDTTLRDGDQAPLVGFSLGEKIRIANAIAALGVDIIEAGFPSASILDFEACRHIAKEMEGRRLGGHAPRVAVMSRCIASDITRAGQALSGDSLGIIHLSLPVSDLHIEAKLGLSKKDLIAKAIDSIRFALGFADSVEMGAEDATRADPDFLEEYSLAVCDAGAKVVNIADTVGEATPQLITRTVSRLVKAVPQFSQGTACISVHCHNDMGLACANTLAGIRSGAGQIEASIAGIGERSGNTSLEEIAAILQNPKAQTRCQTHLNPAALYEANRLVCGILGIGTPPFRAVWGSTSKAHASGIHQHGLSRHPLTYRSVYSNVSSFPKDRTVLSRHSGKAGVYSYLGQYANIHEGSVPKGDLDSAAEQILTLLKERSETPSLGEILLILSSQGIYKGAILQDPGMLQVSESTGQTGGSTIRVRLSMDDGTLEAEEKNLIEALSRIIWMMGGCVPRILSHSVCVGTEQCRAYLETAHPIQENAILVFERTGITQARTLLNCLLDAANANEALSEQ